MACCQDAGVERDADDDGGTKELVFEDCEEALGSENFYNDCDGPCGVDCTDVWSAWVECRWDVLTDCALPCANATAPDSAPRRAAATAGALGLALALLAA